MIPLEVDLSSIGRRILEILPGFFSWSTLIGLTILAFIAPFWIAIFIIVYDLYVLVRAMYMSVHLIYAYWRLRKMKDIDWLDRCQRVSLGVARLLAEAREEARRNNTWLTQQLVKELQWIIELNVKVVDWQSVHHVVILPTYNESLIVLRSSLKALLESAYPKEKLHVVVGFEERVGSRAKDNAKALNKEYQGRFGTFLTAMHPDGLPGEARVKSANAKWAMLAMEKVLIQKRIHLDDVLVSNFDSDTVAAKNYFAQLTYAFITHPDRYHVSYQPLPLYHNNIWDAPAFSRIIASGSTFWQMIESTRPERLVTFSSHAMTWRALHDVGYWQTDIVSEDSRIFWQCLLYYNGNYRTEPLYTSVSMDAALADSWWKTLVNQYKQKRRWAWGVENFPYMAAGFFGNKKINWRIKWLYTIRTLEGHYSWVTTPIIVAGLGWLPVLFGNPDFHSTVLSYNLPYVTRTIMTIAMVGLLISASLSLILLPARPARVSKWRHWQMAGQWIMFPIIATVLSSVPALDAETRLMLGRDLSFNVMQKTRKSS